MAFYASDLDSDNFSVDRYAYHTEFYEVIRKRIVESVVQKKLEIQSVDDSLVLDTDKTAVMNIFIN